MSEKLIISVFRKLYWNYTSQWLRNLILQDEITILYKQYTKAVNCFLDLISFRLNYLDVIFFNLQEPWENFKNQIHKIYWCLWIFRNMLCPQARTTALQTRFISKAKQTNVSPKNLHKDYKRIRQIFIILNTLQQKFMTQYEWIV